ncbi:MAG TPA: EFR1 family ferrodoxin [Feifaniaceae bacterium]|nr:EFR1 family ferrodoxin [Feifaniaceae bacterium]
MICYFSGTGNSEWAAKLLAKEMGEETRDIAAFLKNPEPLRVRANELFGLVFPVYAWGPPRIVERFLKYLQVEPGAFCYAVCTCGDDAGNAIEYLKKHVPIISGYSLQMPNNYIVLYDVDDEQTRRRKLIAAKARIPRIAADIRQKKPVFEVCRGRFPGLKTAAVHPVFLAFATRSKPFHAEEGCTACGLCARACPTGNIAIVGGKPVWGNACEQCMGCINRCPARAIQYGGYTKNKGRYYLDDHE